MCYSSRRIGGDDSTWAEITEHCCPQSKNDTSIADSSLSSSLLPPTQPWHFHRRGSVTKCHSFHSSALLEDQPSATEKTKYLESHGRTILQISLPSIGLRPFTSDVLPELPLLSDSALRGCGFCAFLREAIVSIQIRGDVKSLIGHDVLDLGRRKVTVSLGYRNFDLAFLSSWS